MTVRLRAGSGKSKAAVVLLSLPTSAAAATSASPSSFSAVIPTVNVPESARHFVNETGKHAENLVPMLALSLKVHGKMYDELISDSLKNKQVSSSSSSSS